MAQCLCFVHSEIQSSLVTCSSKFHKRKSYTFGMMRGSMMKMSWVSG